jgi:ankyrin repeat protein
MHDNGISPLVESVNKGYIYIMNIFVKFNGDVNIIHDNDGNTALHYAMLNENK